MLFSSLAGSQSQIFNEACDDPNGQTLVTSVCFQVFTTIDSSPYSAYTVGKGFVLGASSPVEEGHRLVNTAATTETTKSRIGRTELLDSLAQVLACFSSISNEQILPKITALLVSHFRAARAELWLWDETSASIYLTHHSGKPAGHRRDYIASENGVLGKVAEARKDIENIVLSTFGGEDQEFAQRTGLTHISAYPLLTGHKVLLGVIAIYSEGPATAELLGFWHTYAEICGIKIPDVLVVQEQQKQITQLSLLYEATRLLNSTLDLPELLELILRIARQEVHAERGSVFLVDAQERQLWSIVASGLEQEEIRVPFGKGIAGHVAETGEIVNVEDAYELEFFEKSFDQKFNYRTRSLLCMPIRHRAGRIVGVIQLLNKTTAPRFEKRDEDFLSRLSGHMAMALENARLYRETVERQQIEKELFLARGIQQMLLPNALPVVPGYEMAVANEFCSEVGGDYYDFFNVGPKSLLLVVADIERKGLSAALIMSNLQATLRALIMHRHSFETLTESLNAMIYSDLKSGTNLSCFLGMVDTERNGLQFINAGHVPPILVSGEKGSYQLLQNGGIVIGLFPRAEYNRSSVELHPGDVLVCCTDGVLEARNDDGEEYGASRLAQAAVQQRAKSAAEIAKCLIQEVNAWCNHIQADDKVLMVLKVVPESAPPSANRPQALPAQS